MRQHKAAPRDKLMAWHSRAGAKRRRPRQVSKAHHATAAQPCSAPAPPSPTPTAAHLDERNRPADLRLGRDVPDDEAVRAAREAAVGDERDVLAEARTHDDGGWREHLWHARTAFRTLVTDHDHSSLLDLAVLDRLRRSGRAGKHKERREGWRAATHASEGDKAQLRKEGRRAWQEQPERETVKAAKRQQPSAASSHAAP